MRRSTSPRSSAALHVGATDDGDTVAAASAWRRTCSRGTGTRRAGRPRPAPAPPPCGRRPPARRRPAWSRRWRPSTPGARRPRAARRSPSSVTSSALPRPTRSAAFAAEAPGRRDGERLARACRRSRTPAMNVVSRRRARRRPRRHPARARDRRTPGRRAGRRGPSARGSVRDVEADGHGSSECLESRGWVCGQCSPHRPEGAFLPAGERVHEVGEPVEVRDDLAAVEPTVGGRGDRRALGPAHDRAREVERGRDPVLAGQDELLRRVVAGGDVVDDRLERGDHRGGDERHAGLRASGGSSGAVASSAPTTNSSRCSRISSSSSSEPRSASARASPSAETASSTAP